MDANAVAFFKREGYWIDRGVFQGDVLEDLRLRAGAIQARCRREPMRGIRHWWGRGADAVEESEEDQGRASWGVNEITRPELFDASLVNVFGHSRVRAALEGILGPEPRAWGIKILWTPQLVGYNLGWHRDQMGRDFYDFVHLKPESPDHVQFNAALNEDTCFRLVPGSHRRPLTETEWAAVRSDPTAPLPGEVVATLAPGDILYMDAHALHRGRSALGEDRLTLHYSAQAQWVPLVPWGAPEDFAFITSDAFLQALHPHVKSLYERLRTAERTNRILTFIEERATKHGWKM
jgi:hypothetical protein